MRWEKLVKEYFEIYEEGTTEKIRNWISNEKLDFVIDDIKIWIATICNKDPTLKRIWYPLDEKRITKSALVKIQFSGDPILYNINKMINKGLLEKKENYSGHSKYLFIKKKGKGGKSK